MGGAEYLWRMSHIGWSEDDAKAIMRTTFFDYDEVYSVARRFDAEKAKKVLDIAAMYGVSPSLLCGLLDYSPMRASEAAMVEATNALQRVLNA